MSTRIHWLTEHLTDVIPRPSHVLLRSRAPLVAIGLAAGALAALAALHPDFLLEVDEPVSEAIRGDALVGFFRAVTKLGSAQTGMVLAVAFAFVLSRWCRPFAVAYPAAGLAAVTTDLVLKVIVDRPRPPDPDVGTALGAFPSGHVLFAVVVFGLLPPAVWLLTGSKLAFWGAAAAGIIVGIGVAASRVYLGAHWPSDVLASALMGATILLATEYLLASRLARRHCDGCRLHHRRRGAERGQDEPAAGVRP